MALAGKLMTLAEAAERSACSPKTVRRAIDAGQPAAVRLGASAKSDRIHPDDLEDWWKRSRVTAASARSAPRPSSGPLPITSADARIAELLKPKTSGASERSRRSPKT